MAQHITRHNILATDRENIAIGLFWMQRSVVIDAVGKGFNVSTSVCGELSLVISVDGLPKA